MIEIFKGEWNEKIVKSNPDKIYVFGDNNLRTGKKGQSIIRDCPNTIGLRTKKKPSTSTDSYYTDDEYSQNRSLIQEDVENIKWEMLTGKTIVFSSGGYGTGLSELPTRAPKTFDFLCNILISEFGFDNRVGSKSITPPSKAEIDAAKELPMNYEHNKLGYGQLVPGQFRQELLDLGITTTFEAIKQGYRTATSRKEKTYKTGDIIKFTKKDSKEILVCRVTRSSYPVESIPKEYWSKLEGWDVSYFKLNPDAKSKYQFVYEYIGFIDEYGKFRY